PDHRVAPASLEFNPKTLHPWREHHRQGLPHSDGQPFFRKAGFPVEGGQHKPLIQDAVIEKIDPPGEPFLY
ncbi:MAG: hypothetical protein WC076_13700, partial [Terrimicrobiaceae bacterium]